MRNEAGKKKFTDGAVKLEKLINQMGFETIPEYEVGRYSIDIYLPEFNLGVEYDGPMHGLSRGKDKRRDKEIYDQSKIAIMRVRKITTDFNDALLEFIEEWSKK